MVRVAPGSEGTGSLKGALRVRERQSSAECPHRGGLSGLLPPQAVPGGLWRSRGTHGINWYST